MVLLGLREDDVINSLLIEKHTNEEELLMDTQKYEQFRGNWQQTTLKEERVEESQQQNSDKMAFSARF